MQDLKSGSRRRVGAWRTCCAALLAALWLPATASATAFSFGTVSATDVITSLTFAPSADKTYYTPETGTLHVEAYLSQINFSNRPNITGIAPNSVLLTSDVVLVPASFAVVTSSANNPRSLSATFTNGMVDLGILDTVGIGFGPIGVLDTDYNANLAFSATETGAIIAPLPVTGQLSADLLVLGSSDPDFLSAFQPFAEMDANFSGFFSDGVSVTNNLCHLVKNDGSVGGATSWPTTCATPYGLDDFETNAVITIIPIPEPGTALLFGLGLAGVAARRRK